MRRFRNCKKVGGTFLVLVQNCNFNVALKVSSTLEEETTFVQHATLLESFPERIQVLYSKLREIEAEIDRRIEEN